MDGTSRRGTPDLLGRRARLYRNLRTAHLERVRELGPATVIYEARRYDFDEQAAAGLDLVRAGPLRAAWLLARSSVTDLEINEPLMRYGIRGAALAVGALRLRAALGGGRAMIVTYAIENSDQSGGPRQPIRSRVRARLDGILTRYVWNRVDRIAYGTEAARQLYRRVLPPARRPALDTLIPALPRACDCALGVRDPDRVVFLGAFSNRKGFPLLLEAWPHVRQKVSSATITIMGKGALEQSARDWAAGDDSVELLIDPGRDEIHRQLRRGQVLTLPSQPTSTWKEQVGLPITEALAHGCSIVSTSDTGLAGWLAEHGHVVIAPGGRPEELADAIVAMLGERRPASEVVSALPLRDGRLLADDWLFGSAGNPRDGSVPA